MMKYNTISTSSLASEGKKSTLTIYADLDISHNKMVYTEPEMASVREELEMVQKALKLQTKRCRQLVAEYTRKLQEKEQQFYTEKALRDDQLAKVLKALLIFEARLKQEQKFITHQLNERDYIIKKQNNDIQKLLSRQHCKKCNQYYTSSPALESLNSSSEYIGTDYQDYQSSNFESLDSSSETYATISEKGYDMNKRDNLDQSYSGDDNSKTESESTKNIYQKNRNKDSLGRRSRKVPHRKSIGTYFEVLKLRNDTASPLSNEDNTSNDYDNLDSLPPESVTDKISLVSENIETMFNKSLETSYSSTDFLNESSPNVSVSECNNTVINKNDTDNETNTSSNLNSSTESQTNDIETKHNILNETIELNNKIATESKLSKITDSIPVFEGDGETNDNWYASASDPEDEEHRDIYRNNPVLECMNQILLQNINDNLNSPPKTPNIERKTNKNNKRVKFSDEEDKPENALTKENLREKQQEIHDYYETPIQKVPNYYETPQSIYSNDYEQILSKCSETFSGSSPDNQKDKVILSKPDDKTGHFYVDMDTKSESEEQDNKIVRKSKILRTPPALPPKPANLVSKYKIQNIPNKQKKNKSTEVNLESEPDYCSISELNLPPTKTLSFKKINVVAEINAPTSHDVMSKLDKTNLIKNKKENNSDYDPVIVNDNIQVNVGVKKCVEKLNIQLKQTPLKLEPPVIKLQQSPTKKNEPDIPKLPQVSEIIIPDETEEKQQEERISQDNYVKNNSQILKLKTNIEQTPRRPIVIGSSVSSLITGFNNHQLLSEIKKKPERNKLDKTMFSSFENLQNIDKHSSPTKDPIPEPRNFENFDLSQNFEEFKLDDCEIEEYSVEIPDLQEDNEQDTQIDKNLKPSNNSSTRVELIRATNDIHAPNLSKNSIELLKKQLELQKNQIQNEQGLKDTARRPNYEPTYEHFLECTGLSTKSILSPARMISNHKSMLKPKDVKLRSKVKANNNLFERHSCNSIKYWSEPYI